MPTLFSRTFLVLMSGLLLASCSGSSQREATGLELGSKDAVAAAATLASCLDDDDANKVLHFLYSRRSNGHFADRLAAAVQCVGRKNNGCGAVAECLGVSRGPSSGCSEGCTGTLSRDCSGGLAYDMDCAKLAMFCNGTGSESTCTQTPSPQTCDELVYQHNRRCEGDRPIFCQQGFFHTGLSCTELGTDCVAGLCRGRGPSCSETPDPSFQLGSGISWSNGMRCEDKVLVACVDGKEHRVDCASLGPGATCQKGLFCGVASDCDPSNRTHCEGNELVVCNAGRAERVDCVARGFAKCVTLGVDGFCSP